MLLRAREMLRLSDFEECFLATIFSPPSHSNAGLLPHEIRCRVADVQERAARVPSVEARITGTVTGPAMAEFSRRIEDELPFLRETVRRWHRDRAIAEDLVQDTVVRALATAHPWQPGSNLR